MAEAAIGAGSAIAAVGVRTMEDPMQRLDDTLAEMWATNKDSANEAMSSLAILIDGASEEQAELIGR